MSDGPSRSNTTERTASSEREHADSACSVGPSRPGSAPHSAGESGAKRVCRLSGGAGRGRARGSGGLRAREAECAPARAVPPRQATAGGWLACDTDARRRESQRQAHALQLGVHARWCGLGRGALGRLRMRMRAAGPHLHAGPSPRSATQESQLACAAAVHAQRADQRVLREVGRVRAGWNGVGIATAAHMERCDVARRRK